MRTRLLIIGAAWLLLVTPAGMRAEEGKDDRPTGEPGGLFSLFLGGGSAKPGPDETEEPEEEAAAKPAPAEEAAEAPPAPEAEPEPEAESAAVEPTAAPMVSAEPTPEESPAATASKPEKEPETPVESAAPTADEPAWPAGPDTGGTLAERPTTAPEPETTPEPSLAGEPAEDSEPEKREATTTDDAPGVKTSTEEAPSPEIAAREVPLRGGSVAPGAVALPETEIQGEIEKPDIFFLLPKARDQSDDQVIRARIRREITQPLVKEWLEEMMLLK